MKIGIACTNTTTIPVPSGEIYANQEIAGWIADELAARGHDVTLFAPIGSATKAKLITFDMLPFSDPQIYEKLKGEFSFLDYEHLFMSKIYRYAEDNAFDILHMHLRPLTVAPFAAMSRIKTFQTVHDPLTFPYFKTLEFYDDFENIGFVSVSLSQRKALPDFHMKYNVYNGIDLDRWKFNPQGGDKFCWSGRVIPEKGTHRAIEIAQKTGAEMHMAGFVYDGDKNNPDSYWNQKVRPLLGDKIRLDYVPKEKLSDFYGNSKAFINTLEWEEPFGLVMIEAMACGTPVIAFNRGSVKEIVKDGVTGFVVDNEDEMIEAVKNIGSISREACRKHVEENFSIKKMVDSYIEIYKEFINR